MMQMNSLKRIYPKYFVIVMIIRISMRAKSYKVRLHFKLIHAWESSKRDRIP